MALTDRFGLALTTDSPHAVESYIRAVDLLLSANAGAETLLDAALDADPDFALAHIARARLCQVQARIPEAKEAATRARAEADVNWYTAQPSVPMSYWLGRLENDRLRQRLMVGRRWSLQQFNDWLLSFGTIPQAWIEKYGLD